MKLAIEFVSDVAVLEVRDGLVGAESQTLFSEIQQLFTKGTDNFVVDLGEGGQMDSEGIKSLLSAKTFVSKGGGKVVVVNPHHFLILERNPFMHPIPFFEFYRSKEEAIGAFIDQPKVPGQAEAKARRKFTGCAGNALALCLLGAAILAIVCLL
jgi:anti-anti-sigma regulatory factor